jgi:hypothetical protein
LNSQCRQKSSLIGRQPQLQTVETVAAWTAFGASSCENNLWGCSAEREAAPVGIGDLLEVFSDGAKDD